MHLHQVNKDVPYVEMKTAQDRRRYNVGVCLTVVELNVVEISSSEISRAHEYSDDYFDELN